MQSKVSYSSADMLRFLRRLATSFRLFACPSCVELSGKFHGEFHGRVSSQIRTYVSLVTMAALLVASSRSMGQAPALRRGSSEKPTLARHRQLKPAITGTDGTQTGIADFSGNFTTVSTPTGALSLFRRANCSLSLATGTYSIEPTFAYTQTELTANYERVLHSEAQLTTTPDVFAKGCAMQPVPGFGSLPGLFVGTTTSGVNVFAGLGEVAPTFVTGVYVLTGVSTFSMSSFQFSTAGNLTAGDLNKDGNGDLVITNMSLATSAYVTVMLGNADGTFKNGVTYPIAGDYSVAAVLDDVNNDGNLDIVAISGDQQISVLLGNGDGTFKAAQSFDAPVLPGYTSAASTPIQNLITADVNNDGNKDIICSNGLVLLGDGTGTFTAVAAPAFPYIEDTVYAGGPNLASGDLNNDGKMDLVVNNGSSVFTWLGNGDGTFTQGQTYASIPTDGFVIVDDLDGDGNADIFVGLGDGGTFNGDDGAPGLGYALMGNGNGTFQGAPQISVGAYTGNNLADVTGSGTLDLITNTINTPYGFPLNPSSTFTVQLGTGKGAFVPKSTITAPASFVLGGTTYTGANTAVAETFALGDINGDGKADLVFTDATSPNTVYFTSLSNGDGTFQAPVPNLFPQIAPAADFDTGLTLAGQQITNLTKGGHAGLIFTFNETAGTSFGGPAVNTYNQGFIVLPGNGDGTFGSPVITSTYSSNTAPTISNPPQIVAVADVNGDGNPDLIVNTTLSYNVNGGTSELQVYLGNGDGTFKAPSTLTTVSNPNGSLVMADFNNDGKLDLAVMSETDAGQVQLVICLGNGDGTFAAPSILDIAGGVYTGAGGEYGLAAADFNGDGNVDLALTGGGYSANGIFYGKGDGTFMSVNTGTTAAPELVPQDLINIGVGGTASIGAVLTSSGKPDLLVGNTILLNQYGTSTTSQVASSTALCSSATSITSGSSVTFTATVTGPSGDATVPTGSVTFMDGSTTLGTGPLSSSGVATYSTTALPTGSDSITAVYPGDGNFLGSTSAAVVVTVNAAPVIIATSTTLSATATSVTSGTSLILTATVTPVTGTATPTGTVTFIDGTTTLGVGTVGSGGTATYTTSTLAVGTNSITAAYGGTTTFSPSTSAAIDITVTAAVTPSFALSLTPTSGTVSKGSSVTSTISVTPAGGFNQAVSLTCSGAPKHASCSISPTSVTPTGASVSTAILTIETDVKTSQLNRQLSPTRFRGNNGATTLAFLGGGVLLGLTLLRRRRRIWWYLQIGVVLLAMAVISVTGCVGPGNSTPSGNYTITVTATSGSNSQTAAYSLSVQ